MSSKTPVKTPNGVLIAVLSILLVCATLSGCAKDGSSSPFNAINQTPSSFAEARNEFLSKSSAPTIRQTSFESEVAEQQWHNSLTTAIAEAQSDDKLILANFTGSDWCHFCVKLKDEVFSAAEFKSWANESVVLLEIDSPKRTRLPKEIRDQNEMLKSRFNITSFPTVLLLDVDGNVLAKMGYERGKSPSQWVQIAESRLQQSTAASRSIATGQNSETLIR